MTAALVWLAVVVTAGLVIYDIEMSASIAHVLTVTALLVVLIFAGTVTAA